MQPNRKEAWLAGLDKFVGSACRVCANKIRYTINGSCVPCTLERSRRYHKAIAQVFKKAKIRRAAEETANR